ncbi:MAG TPA: apolipoprotein N-acyltransferase [Verrucomicrobiae bacterium]|nr:apolipoprotein N-acyltransferase [Verrucomicrobiae bacterium]
MNFSWYTRALLAIASGVALGLSFPNYNLALLAWISVGLLVLASVGAPPKQAPLYGFLHGLAFYPVCVPWIDTVMHKYGDVDPLTSAGLVLLLAATFGLMLTIFSWGVAQVSRKGVGFACGLAPALWVAVELLRTRLPILGFPWCLSGYAATGSLALLQVVSVTGIYGLSLLVAGYGSLFAYAVLVRRGSVWKILLATSALLILAGTEGKYLVPLAKVDHIAHLVQTDFPQSEEYPSNWLQVHAADMNELEEISVNAARRTPGIVIWPEVPAPFSLQDLNFQQRAVRIAQRADQYFLVGIVDWKLEGGGKWIATNSAVLLDPSGRRVFTYDKIHLVPFGEYVPLRKYLTFAKRLTADISDFTPGTEYRVGAIPGGRIGVFICYESIFPDEIRRFAKGGATLLVNISNDGWFGRSSAPAQHLMMVRVRAVESRRWLLRDTNNGFTVSIDPYGRIVAELEPDVRGQLDAPYGFRTDESLYVRFGDWLAWVCVAASIALLALTFFKRPLAGTGA